MEDPGDDSKATHIRTTALDKAFVYPCSKGDVVRIFGRDRLESAWFGLMPRFEWDSRSTHHPKLHGPVLAELSTKGSSATWLLIYQLPQKEFAPEIRERLVDAMSKAGLEWLSRIESRPPTAHFGPEQLLFTLVPDSDGESRIETVEHRYRLGP